MESVQRRFTKRIPGLENDDRLTFLSLDSLELRRLKADLLLTYKIIFALVDVDCDNYFNVRRDNITRGHRFRIIPEHSVINRRKKISAK